MPVSKRKAGWKQPSKSIDGHSKGYADFHCSTNCKKGNLISIKNFGRACSHCIQRLHQWATNGECKAFSPANHSWPGLPLRWHAQLIARCSIELCAGMQRAPYSSVKLTQWHRKGWDWFRAKCSAQSPVRMSMQNNFIRIPIMADLPHRRHLAICWHALQGTDLWEIFASQKNNERNSLCLTPKKWLNGKWHWLTFTVFLCAAANGINLITNTVSINTFWNPERIHRPQPHWGASVTVGPCRDWNAANSGHAFLRFFL